MIIPSNPVYFMGVKFGGCLIQTQLVVRKPAMLLAFRLTPRIYFINLLCDFSVIPDAYTFSKI
jgi:hypothetical protein